MNTVIYYFSGSGNSLFVAKKIAAALDAELISVTSLKEQTEIEVHADRIGIVFPVQDFKPPVIIMEFIKKLHLKSNHLEKKYIFAVCTAGLSPGKTLTVLDKALSANGGKLSAGFGILMPHNGIGSSEFSEKKHQKMFTDCDIKIEAIIKHISEEKTGTPEVGSLFIDLVLSGLMFRMLPTLFKLLKQVMFKGWESLAFKADEKCDGCGICVKICPVDNIVLAGKNPVWGKTCAGCFACIQWCPKDSIHLGTSDMNVKKYHHPEISLNDMLKQKGERA